MPEEKILIMAKSAKYANYCIAGLTNCGKWIRVISTNPELEEAVPAVDATYADGTEANLLDVVKIRLLKTKVENPIQPENIYYDERFRWKKVETLPLATAVKFFGNIRREKIFYNDERSVDPAYIKRLPQNLRESLIFLPVKDLIIKVENRRDTKKFYAHFTYNGKKYFKFSVGDIAVRQQFQNHFEGEYSLSSKAYVVFSLTNPFRYNGKCYKMVAQVF